MLKQTISKWFSNKYHTVFNSIAFYPVITAFLFLLLSIVMVTFDFSEQGKQLKANLEWLRLKDATTARSIISSIAAGIISLTVFSFSMVMIVLNQAASQMSNRVLDNLIGNRFQQVVLGIYIGTIVYSLFLLSTIRDVDSGIYIPALSVYLLIVLTIIDIFLFIYFLHYITNAVKYETIIHRIFEQTLKSMKKSCSFNKEPEILELVDFADELKCETTGIYQGFDKGALLEICKKEDFIISFLRPRGSFLVEGTVFATSSKNLTDELKDQIQMLINIHRGDDIDKNYYYGFNQLVEVAVKALSPGVNDPGTAVQSLRALTGLLVFRFKHFPGNVIVDENGEQRIMTYEKSLEEVFRSAILPIWEYGNKDTILRSELLTILLQLQLYGEYPFIQKLINVIKQVSIKEEVMH